MRTDDLLKVIIFAVLLGCMSINVMLAAIYDKL